MAKLLELNADSKDALCLAGKALSSSIRVDIIKLLYQHSLNIAEIAEMMSIPASSAALHVRVLEEAGLINTEVQPGERGSMKLCSRKCDYVTIRLESPPEPANETISVNMPIGAYTDCKISPTCGLVTERENIGNEDMLYPFYLPERVDAQLLWSSSGYVEYLFPYSTPKFPKQLSISFEICSEAPNYREDWKSDLTLWVNGIEVCTWTSLGDYGVRRGRLNPSWWRKGNTQYGMLTTCSISDNGTSLNGQRSSACVLQDLGLSGQPFVKVRIGNKPNARNIGGFNLFGDKFGDHAQAIVMTIEY